jgi:hypothetical protein
LIGIWSRPWAWGAGIDQGGDAAGSKADDIAVKAVVGKMSVTNW